MKRLFQLLLVICVLLVPYFAAAPQASAFDLRTDKITTVNANEKDIKNLYVFGSAINILAPVRYDVVSAGRDISVDGPVAGSVNAAGNTILIKGNVGNSARVAGGTVIIDSKITNDLIVAGGDVSITKNAQIGGDLIVAGGTVTIDGPVAGKIYFEGGQISVNSIVGRGMEGNVKNLTLGPVAVINGDVKYTSENKAVISPSAKVSGNIAYTQRKSHEQQDYAQSVVNSAAVYKLIIDILLSMLFIYFLGGFLLIVMKNMKTSPWKNMGVGFGFLLVFPIAAVFMLLFIWLGLAAFLAFGLLAILATFVSKVFIGWTLLNWYEQRNKKKYMLDWKAGIVGPIVLFLVALVPVLGWLAIALLFLVSLGALLQQFVSVIHTQKL